MNKVIIFWFCTALYACSPSNSSNVREEKKLQSLLMECAGGPKDFFSVDTNLERLLSKSIVKAVDSFETVTVFDIINLSNYQRIGIIQINDTDNFFQYSRNSDTSAFVFQKGADGFLELKKLSKFLSRNFDKNIDSAVHIVRNHLMADANIVIISRITNFTKQGKCISFSMQYNPEEFLKIAQ